MTIQTGYGVEGALPDAIARRIIENEITPNFKSGDYFAGINQGTDAIISYTKGEYKTDAPKARRNQVVRLVPFIIIFIVIILAAIKRGGGGGGGSQVIGGRGGASPFWWLLLGSQLGRGSGGGGGFGGFSGGGGGFGGGRWWLRRIWWWKFWRWRSEWFVVSLQLTVDSGQWTVDR